MAISDMKPQNFEEKLIWYTLIGTYALYFLGAQFFWVSTLAWFLTLYLIRKLWNQNEETPSEEKITIPGTTCWIWIISMLFMWVTLIIGHLDFKLDNKQIFVSSLDFTKTWALFALFPVVSCLKIRPQLIYRAVCIVCLQSIILILINYLLIKLNIKIDYDSPLQLIARGGKDYYNVTLGASAPDPLEPSAEIRMQLFAPWAPALGLAGNIYFFLASQESNIKWRFIGMVGAVAMIAVSVSRAGMVCLPAVLLLTWILTTIFNKPLIQIAIGVFSFFGGVLAPPIIDIIETTKDSLISSRAGSSKVRKILKEIELYRWKEAPIWGHGVAEPGPELTANMPIGSHDTWIALLFVRGSAGLLAAAIPMAWSLINLLIKAQFSKTAKVALSIVLALVIFGFSEGLDVLAYVYWPGLLVMGIAFKEKVPVVIESQKEYVIQ